MIKRIIISFITVVLLWPFDLSAQDKPFIHFTEDDGLAGNNVYDITKDRKGYLWIATENGLSKYDGEKFINYREAEGLPGNRVWAVTHDNKNRIYAGCYKYGLAIIENDKVVKILHLHNQFPDTFRKLYYSDKYDALFVGTDYGIYLLKDTVFYELHYPKQSNHKAVILSITPNNNVVYFTNHDSPGTGGLYKIEVDIKNPKKSVVKLVEIKNKISNNMFGSTSMNGEVFTNNYHFIYRLQSGSGKLKLLTKTEPQFLTWAMASTGKNSIYLGGSGEGLYKSGLKVLNTLTGEVSTSPYNIDARVINNLFYDSDEEIIWACTENGLFSLVKTPFEIIGKKSADGVNSIGITGNSLYVLAKDNVWLYKGYQRYLLYTKKSLEKIFTSKGKAYFRNQSIPGLNFARPIILSHFISDHDKLFLVSTWGTVSVPDLKTYLPITTGKFITEAKGGLYWAPDYIGLQYSSSLSGTPKFESWNPDTVHDVQKIATAGGITWFASFYNGLYAIKNNKVFVLNSENSDIDNSLTDLDINNKGEVWATSSQGNLFQVGFNGKLSIIRRFNKNNSGITGEIYDWLKFNKNYLYLGADKGLNIIPLSQLYRSRLDSVIFYNKSNGYEFLSAGSPIADPQGNIYIHNSDKIIKISNAFPARTSKKITFSGIKINNQPVSPEQLAKGRLSATTKSITIDFLVIKYPGSQNIHYRYKVNDNSWTEGNKLFLQSLKPGKYIIRFEAKDTETAITYHDHLSFEIRSPFWQSWVFLVLLIMVISSLAYLIVRVRINTLKKQQEEKNRLIRKNSELHIQSLQAQMNPHFVFNALNSIQSYILTDRSQDAMIYLGTLGSLIRMNLENVTEEYIPLFEEIRFLKKYIEIEKMRFQEKLNVDLVNQVTEPDILIPPMLIQPLIENAIKHGIRNVKHEGLIKVNFSLENKLIHITVEDNGAGRAHSKAVADKNHKSKGLDLIIQRLNLLNEKNRTDKFQLSILDLQDNGLPTGTKVLITIPKMNGMPFGQAE